jgi:hypothetical protein
VTIGNITAPQSLSDDGDRSLLVSAHLPA